MIPRLLKFFRCKGQTSEKSQSSNNEIKETMELFINRPVYQKLTRSNLDNIPDSELNQTIFDNISINMKGDNRSESEIIKDLSKGQQAVYSIWVVESEVNNGGFNQLYFNGYEEIAKIAETTFLTVEATKFADLIRRANQLYQKLKPELEKFDDGTAESFSKSYENNQLEKFDDEFYSIYETENLSDLIVLYVRNHIDEFIEN